MTWLSFQNIQIVKIRLVSETVLYISYAYPKCEPRFLALYWNHYKKIKEAFGVC